MIHLSEFFKRIFEGSERVAILSAGSCLMADDAAGAVITDTLIERFGPEPERFRIFSGGTAPECFTGEIKRFHADHVLLIDAADFGGAPGEVCSIDPARVEGVSFSTHMLPLKVMLDYLNKELGCKTTIVGIQPKCLEFGGEMTAEVRAAVEEMIEVLGQDLSA